MSKEDAEQQMRAVLDIGWRVTTGINYIFDGRQLHSASRIHINGQGVTLSACSTLTSISINARLAVADLDGPRLVLYLELAVLLRHQPCK